MTTDEQRIFVCEKLLGWKLVVPLSFLGTIIGIPPELNFKDMGNLKPIPPLTLDWLWECENKLEPDQFPDYLRNLEKITSSECRFELENHFARVHASAEQRLTALVETIKII